MDAPRQYVYFIKSLYYVRFYFTDDRQGCQGGEELVAASCCRTARHSCGHSSFLFPSWQLLCFQHYVRSHHARYWRHWTRRGSEQSQLVHDEGLQHRGRHTRCHCRHHALLMASGYDGHASDFPRHLAHLPQFHDYRPCRWHECVQGFRLRLADLRRDTLANPLHPDCP